MTKNEFLKELCTELSGLSATDKKSSVEYYSEIIADKVDSGISEEAAVSELGAPKDIAREIMVNMPISKVIKSKIKKNKRPLKIWEIICLILGSPIWISLLAAMLCILLSVYVVIWSVFISIFAVDVAAFAVGLGLSVASIFKLASTPANATMLCGIGLCGIGIGAFLFLPILKLLRVFVKITVNITKGLKVIMIGKDKKT